VQSLAIAGAACGFAAVSILAKLAYEAGAAPGSLFAARLVVAGAVLCPLARPPGRVPARALALAVAGGAAFAAAGLLEFTALSRLPASMLVTIVFVSPVWVGIGSSAVNSVAPERRAWVLYGVVLTGLALLVGAPRSTTLDPVGVALALSASLLFAAVFLILEQLVRLEPWDRAVSWVTLTAAAPLAALHPTGVIDEVAHAATSGYAIAVGTLTAASLLLLGRGLTSTSAFRASVIAAVEPLAATLLALALLGETISPLQAVGGAAVIAGVTAIGATPDDG
jgi:drug/metabolite transporter (DMT)-like permease